MAWHKLHFSTSWQTHLQLGNARPVYEDEVNIVYAQALQDLVACKLRLDGALLQCMHCASDEIHFPCSSLLVAADVKVATESSQGMTWEVGGVAVKMDLCGANFACDEDVFPGHLRGL